MNTEKRKLKTLIVDDEPLARRTIRDLLANDPDIEVMGECATGLEAVTHMREQEPDLLFLDIQMPGMTGFEALAQVEFQRIPAIIFVTAFDQYAVKAFEVHALDYLMKPFTDQRFNEALQKAKSSIELKEINRLSPKSPGFARQSRGDRTHRHQTLSQTVHDSIRRTRLFH